jgi:hypothetical protein
MPYYKPFANVVKKKTPHYLQLRKVPDTTQKQGLNSDTGQIAQEYTH